MNRRRILSALALGTVPVSGCLDRGREVGISTNGGSSTTISTDSTEDPTEATAPKQTTSERTTPEQCTKTVPLPEDPYFADVSIKNRTDESKTVEMTVSKNSSEVFRREYEVPPGALIKGTQELFTDQGTYEVTATVGQQTKTSDPVTPTSNQWRFFNGVRVELESENDETTVGFLYPHGDKGTTPPC